MFTLKRFQDIEVGQKFCFAWLNEDRKDNWYTKIDDSEFKADNDEVGSIYDQEDGKDTEVRVEV